MNMRLFPELGEDLLDTASLPPTDNTELNYRTRPLSPEHELRLTFWFCWCPSRLSFPCRSSPGGWSGATRCLTT